MEEEPSKLRVVAMKPKKVKASEDEAVFVTPELPEVIKYLTNYVDKYGCSEMQIIMLDSDMNADIIGTVDRSTTMLGAMQQAVFRYTQELEDEAEEE